MPNNLIAAIEADINKLAIEQDKRPHDVQIALRRQKLKEIAMDYVKLEDRYREVAEFNSAY